MPKPRPLPHFYHLGFTFIELLVTVTIIGILTSIAVVGYRSITTRSRDAKRKADLEQIRSALEIYRSASGDNTYPASLLVLSPDYLPKIPTDPKTYTYIYSPDPVTSRSYDLCAYLETLSAPDCVNGDCCADTDCGGETCNYEVVNP